MATRQYDEGGPESYDQFRTTGRGVHLRGKAKGVRPEAVGKPIVRTAARREGRDLKGSGITGMTLETK